MSANDYQPKTLVEAIRYFADEDTCFEYMVKMRWPDGITCPHCGCKEIGFISTIKKWRCKNHDCKKRFSLKSGTIMEDSPLGLDKWLTAIWLIANAKNGISSCELARSIGVTQKTAWFMLHRIRLAMDNGSLEKFQGEVEADESFVGGKAKNMHESRRKAKIQGRGGSGKAIVLGVLERSKEKGESKVQACVVQNRDRQTLKREIEQRLEKGSTLITDEHSGYDALNAEYVRLVVNHTEKYVDGNIYTNGIENFWTLLKRCIKGTYVSVEPFHLYRYVTEQTYRFNHRKGHDGDRFVRLLGRLAGKRITYKQLIGDI